MRGYSYDDLDRLIGETKIQEPGFTNFTVYSYDDTGRRIVKASTAFDVHYVNGAGDRLAGWAVTRTNTPFCTVAGTASESIGTDPRYGVREVSGGIRAVTPAVSGSNFIAQVAFETLGGKSVVASVPDAAGNVGVATNNFVLAAYTAGDYLSDDAGCVTQIVYAGAEDWHERALSWDSEYRLTTVATNGSAAEGYGFDPFGRRIWTASAGVTNWHLYDGPHVLADLDAAGGVLRTYLYGPGIDELVAMTVYTGTVAQTYYAIRDHQNTVWAWVDESGVVVESYDFDAWGRVLEVYDDSGAPLDCEDSRLGNRYLWQGREYSWQTGLYYFRARWYDPVTGRWLSNDPIGISGGVNQYVFCANNPVNVRDPLGLQGFYDPVINLWRVGGGTVLGLVIGFDIDQWKLNHGGLDQGGLIGRTYFGTWTFFGDNFDRLTPAAQAIMEAHEERHRYGQGEECVRKATIADVDRILNRGSFGEYLGQGGRPLMPQELSELNVIKAQSQVWLQEHQMTIWQQAKGGLRSLLY